MLVVYEPVGCVDDALQIGENEGARKPHGFVPASSEEKKKEARVCVDGGGSPFWLSSTKSWCSACS